MSRRILTVDDSKTMRDMLAATLRSDGWDVLQGEDGLHGIEVLGDTPVDVIITDLNMPKLDGFGFIRRMRQHPVHKATPILMLTTESDPAKKAEGKAAGATGWLVKPFDPAKLLQVVRKVCP
ncbi:MAG: response regulator [Alphaproteobacteria bacterium]|nr:response regulator [Alphaproteobacteria bacterium]MBF0394055.1 response regulator [Alphaproteobacteria bacterium]